MRTLSRLPALLAALAVLAALPVTAAPAAAASAGPSVTPAELSWIQRLTIAPERPVVGVGANWAIKVLGEDGEHEPVDVTKYAVFFGKYVECTPDGCSSSEPGRQSAGVSIEIAVDEGRTRMVGADFGLLVEPIASIALEPREARTVLGEDSKPFSVRAL